MPAAIAMATSKMSPVLAPGGGSMSTISIPVSAYHDPANNVITITPYILLKTTTVAEQMQALRQEKKIGKAPETPAGAMRVKRRADLSKLGLPEPKPASVSRRNARERNRVKQVNQGFETLREHVPNGKKNKKMSKVQTLRSAAQYIKDLYMILHGELPALGSPNVIDEHDPDSPLDNSDIEMNVSSPESLTKTPTLQQQAQLLQQVSSPPASVICQSPPSLQLPVIYQKSQISSLQVTPSNQPQQRHTKAVPLILKKEPSVLHQQLARALQQSPSVLKQQLQAPLPVQTANLQVHHHQLRLALNQMQSITLDRRDVPQEDIHSPMSTGETGNHNHLSTSDISDHNPMEDNDQLSPQDSDTSLHSDCSPPTYTQLSPSPYLESSYTSNETLVQRLMKPSSHNTSDLNMNLVSSDLSMLHNYFRSVHSDQDKHFWSDLTRTLNSPAPSLSSMGSSSGSDVSVVYDCESVDKEALLDISNWISELCSSQVDNDMGHN